MTPGEGGLQRAVDRAVEAKKTLEAIEEVSKAIEAQSAEVVKLAGLVQRMATGLRELDDRLAAIESWAHDFDPASAPAPKDPGERR